VRNVDDVISDIKVAIMVQGYSHSKSEACYTKQQLMENGYELVGSWSLMLSFPRKLLC
jgi:hypothetical protein